MFKIVRDVMLRNVAKTACYECHKMGFDFSPEEIKYVVECQLSNPNVTYSGEDVEVENDVKKLTDITVHYLCTASPVLLKVILIQAAFISSYKNKETVIQKYQLLIDEKTRPMVEDICLSNPKTNEQKDALYKKIILIVVLLSGLGDPTVKNVFSNAEAALNSIFPQKNINTFIMLSSFKEKRCEIKSLSKTVTGIRLYNQARVTKENLHPEMQLVAKACSKLRERLEPTVQIVSHGVKALERLLDRRACLSGMTNTNVIDAKDYLKPNELQDASDYLMAIDQARLYLLILLQDTQTSQQQYYIAQDVFNDTIESLNSDLEGKHVIPMNKVLPKFKEIGENWCRVQEVKVALVAINQIFTNILSLIDIKKVPKWVNKLLSLPDNQDISLKDMTNRIYEMRINVCDTHYMIDHEMIINCEFLGRFSLNRSTIQYHGFCPVTCLETGGLLLEGNINIGLLRYNGQLYSFRQAMSAYKFDKDPQGYIAGLIDFSRIHIEYIEALGLQDVIFNDYRGPSGPLGTKVDVRRPIVRDTSVQTEVHPIPRFIDPNYLWNIWDYKKQALLMANIINCRTKSAQTFKSEVRESVITQTYSPRDRRVQTRKDQGTHTMAAVTFLARIRGSKTGAFTAYMLSPPDIDCVKGVKPRMPCERSE